MMSRVLGLAVGLTLAGAQCALATPRGVCGLNCRSGMTLEQWTLDDGSRSTHKEAPLEDHRTLARLQELTRTDLPADEGVHLGMPPAVWLIRGANNAYAWPVMDGEERRVGIILDDPWIRRLSEEAENDWPRAVIMAHELGHVIHGDVWGLGRDTTWDREYQADVFAGYAMAKLGAPRAAVKGVYSLFAVEYVKEYSHAHPSLSYRHRAIDEGYRKAEAE